MKAPRRYVQRVWPSEPPGNYDQRLLFNDKIEEFKLSKRWLAEPKEKSEKALGAFEKAMKFQDGVVGCTASYWFKHYSFIRETVKPILHNVLELFRFSVEIVLTGRILSFVKINPSAPAGQRHQTFSS